MENTRKKNLPWLLVHLHSSENQTIPSWTGLNILLRNEHVVAKDRVGYHYQCPSDSYVYHVPSPSDQRNLVSPKHCCCV